MGGGLRFHDGDLDRKVLYSLVQVALNRIYDGLRLPQSVQLGFGLQDPKLDFDLIYPALQTPDRVGNFFLCGLKASYLLGELEMMAIS